MSLNKILGGLLKVLQFWKKGHDAGLWDQRHGNFPPMARPLPPAPPPPRRPGL